jgi:hypothetical protein
MRRLHHATPPENTDGCVGKGLLVSKANGARRVWFHSAFMRRWALAHVAKRHHVRGQTIAVLECVVPDHWLTWFSEGVYFIDRDLPPANIFAVTEEAIPRRKFRR